ncbi:MAG TPA: hypothetical protein VJL37_08860 [Flavobacterium sp.]|nr:hypothetical protein [Flavobacterium sp.]
MKKGFFLLSFIFFTALQSCSDKKETITKETVIIQNDTVLIQENNTIQKEPLMKKTDSIAEDGTAISVDKNGVKISTKSGNNNVKIEMKNNQN